MQKNKDLNELAEKIKVFADERNWSQFHGPKNQAIALNLEAAEVLELFQFSTDNNAMPEREGKIGEELADVLYWVIKLAEHYNVDLVDALHAKLEHNATKYPIETSKNSYAKYNEK